MKKTLKSILAVVSAIVIVVLVCASCSKLGKCKCTSITYKNGEEYIRTETETSAPASMNCSSLNSETSTQSAGTELKMVLTCVEK